MRSLFRAEWLRQRRRLDLWVLPVAVLATAAWGWYTGLTAAERSLDMPPGFPVPPDLDQQIARLRDPYAFPSSFHAIATSAFLGFVAAVHFGASWTGSEFARGTIRNIFLVHPTRLPFFAVRLVALACLTLLVVLGLVAVSAILPIMLGVTSTGSAAAPSLAALAAYGGMAWFALWFLALGATAVALLLRSAASAVLVIFIYVLAELIVGNAPIWQDVGRLAWLPELLPVGRMIQGLSDVAVVTGFTQASSGDPSQIVVVPGVVGGAILGAWTLLFLATLVWRVRTMDIGE